MAPALLERRCNGGRTEWAFNEPAAATTSVELNAVRASFGCTRSVRWCLCEDAVKVIARELISHNFCVIDGLLGDDFHALRDDLYGVRQILEPSQLAGGRTGANLSYTHAAVRGDHVGWFSGTETDLWPRGALAAYLGVTDALVAKLRGLVPSLAATFERSQAMVACYNGGARYARHCDNACSATHGGKRCNGRRLTAIYYLKDGWRREHGGALRLYAPFVPEAVEEALGELRKLLEAHRSGMQMTKPDLDALRARAAAVSLNDDSPALCDVAPIADRLLLFFADQRVPHEVLPAHAERLAVTTWYFDRDEKAAAQARGAAADAADAYEGERIATQMQRLEERFGPRGPQGPG